MKKSGSNGGGGCSGDTDLSFFRERETSIVEIRKKGKIVISVKNPKFIL